MKEDPPYIKKFKENTLEKRLNEIKTQARICRMFAIILNDLGLRLF